MQQGDSMTSKWNIGTIKSIDQNVLFEQLRSQRLECKGYIDSDAYNGG